MTDSPGTVTPVAYSHALIPGPGDSMARTRAHLLNDKHRRLARCVWPGCDSAMILSPSARVGPLCRAHADLIADAVLEDRLVNRYVEVHAETMRMDQLKRQRSAQLIEDENAERQRRRDNELRRDQPGWVYYLLVGDRVKVGFSTDVRRRLRSYPPGSELLAVEPGSLELEAERHRQFRQYLVAGREWFRPDVAVIEHCSAVVDRHGRPNRFAR